MRFRRLDGFKEDYKKLQPDEQDLVDKALEFLAVDTRHPSLRLKRLEGYKGVWEARASRELRFTFTWVGEVITLRVVGHHDEVLRSP
jgi:mRNA-degrading endonuclease YafQ of YafQ-DinJ toxin-antitoxin module